MKRSRRFDWVLALTLVVMAVSCSGNGCGGCAMEPIPGGFPANERAANAVQIRVTSSAIAEITSDPAAVVGPLVGTGASGPGTIEFQIPGTCTGTAKICCVNGAVTPVCGPLEIDLNRVGNELPRMELIPTGASTLHLIIRARLETLMEVPVSYSFASCGLNVNTAPGGTPDVRIEADITFSQDPTTGTTRIAASNVALNDLGNEDVELTGFCGIFGGDIKQFIIGLITDQLTGTIDDTINEAVCKKCAGGDVAECGSSFATACTAGECKVADRCLQETGAVGRARGTALFGSLSPGTTGAVDIYEALGGYGLTNNGGISLGMLGGMLPGGAERDRCGPPGTKPPAASVTQLPVLQTNTRDVGGTATAYDVGIGVHKSQLDAFAYGAYDGGLLCLTIGHSQVAQLTTDTLALLSRSLGNLVATSAPMSVGLRPQKQPTITLGANTFAQDGSLTAPLLDINFEGMEIDFFASVDEQYIRVFTVVADVHLPVGLQAGAGSEIVPVLGDVDNAFTNLSVKNSEAVLESPADLAALFPSLLNLVLPQLQNGLGGFELPALGGLTLRASSITSIENNTFLAIFADVMVSPTAKLAPVDTHVTIAEVFEPEPSVARDPAQWTKDKTPAVVLDMGDARDQEWSYRLNGGMWSGWSSNRRVRISPRSFWIPGVHTIDVRARVVGHPESTDLSPVSMEVPLGDAVLGKPTAVPFHGSAGEGGCACDSGGSKSGAGLLAVLLLGLVLPVRRVAGRLGGRLVRRVVRGVKRLGPVLTLTVIALIPGCDCGSDAPCGEMDCMDGELPNGGLGRYTSIDGSDERVLVATYDTGLGDAVIADVTDPAKIEYIVVDGVPDVTPTFHPSTYRGGITDAGPNVGTWTSVAVYQGLGRAAYHDVDNGALRVAIETDENEWTSYELDAGGEELAGLHTSMTTDATGKVAIAYVAEGVPDGAGHFTTELRLVRSTNTSPSTPSDWAFHTIVTGNGTCAGRCGGSQECIAGATATDPQTCTATVDTCGVCGDGQACVNNACTDVIAAPSTSQLASGTGLYASLTTLPDGRLAVAYYDNVKHALAVSLESAAGSNSFTETIVDAAGDRGMWASARSDAAGALHIAYQDAIGDQLLYTTFAGTPGPIEVVDDGTRTGDRTHNVGASAALYFNGATPVIAYQDGLVSDVYVATKGSTWSTTALAAGPLVDGISIAATTGPGGSGYIAWDSIDPAADVIHRLVVRKQ